jgi:alpha-beta hydrolase superfamily lysophospholipase
MERGHSRLRKPAAVARFRSELLGRAEGSAEPGWIYLGERDDVVPRLVFQPVTEPKRGKTSAMSDAKSRSAVTEAAPEGVVVVAHGGQEASSEATTAVQLAVLRMVPVARAIKHALAGHKIQVLRPRFTVRGWNGDAASPVGDLTALLDGIRARYGMIPVTLVGHSMGARAALRAAGHPSVQAVAALAPWVPPGEPVAQLAGRRVLLAHGDRDTVTRPGDTWAFAERAREVAQAAAIEVRTGEHAMLRRAHLWHALAAEFARASFGVVAGEEEWLAATLRDTRPGRVRV